MELSHKTRRILLTMFKLSLGVITAVGIGYEIGILNYYSAGSIALITLLTSKWESLRQSGWRIVTYFITVAVTFLLERIIPYPIVCFGLAIGIMYLICELLHVLPVLAVNGVICSHFVSSGNFTLEMIINEFLVVLIGAVVALIFNQLYTRKAARRELGRRMNRDEHDLTIWLYTLADRLEEGNSALPSLAPYERQLNEDLKLAEDFDENSYHGYSDYFISYFRMRLKQIEVLKSLDWELQNFSVPPSQTKVIADYIRYLARFIYATHFPVRQEEKLNTLLNQMRNENLPSSREEFENRAVLFHILMTIREFITLKHQFIESLSEAQKRVYWNMNTRDKNRMKFLMDNPAEKEETGSHS